jgi:putative salt-induced outer membrane protein
LTPVPHTCMEWYASIQFLSAVVLLVNAAGAGQDRAAVAAVLANERALADAMHARERAPMERLLSDDFVLRGAPDVDRGGWIRNALSLCWGSRSDIDRFHLRNFGNVAIASFELTFHVDPATCQPALLRSLVTDTWVGGAGGWKLVVRHSAAPPGPGVTGQYGAVPRASPVWEVSSELSLVATGGNSSTRTLGAGADVTHRGRRVTTLASIEFMTSEADAITRARSVRLHGRPAFRLGPRTELFLRGAFERDRFAGIAGRITADSGLSYTMPLPRRQSLRLEAGGGFSSEERFAAEDVHAGVFTSAVGYAWAARPGSEVRHDLAVTADVAVPRNWRGTSTTEIGVTVTRLVSLQASLAIEYRNAPVPGFRPTDVRTAAALVLRFRRYAEGRSASP